MRTTIGIKVGFAFFVLLLLFGVAGTNIYYSVNDGMSTLEQIQEEARKQIETGNLRFRVTQVLMASNDYVITNKEFYKQEYQRLNALLDKDYQDFIQSGLTDKEKQLAYEVRIDIDSIRKYSERIFSIANSRQSSYAWKLMEIMDYNFGKAINTKTTLIFDGISERIEEYHTNAEMAKQKITALVQRMMLISLIISLIIIYLSIVNIARPIRKITKAANFIAKGDYSKRIEVKTHDEIASLADSFNQMCESIQRSNKALGDSKRYVESIIEAEPECVCVISQDGTLQSINPAGLRIIDADTSEQVVGKTVDQLITPEHLQSFQNLTENVFKGAGGTLQYEIVGMKGRRRWLETNSVPLYADAGHIVGNLGINRDITERKLAEEYLLKFRMGIEKSCDAVLLTDPDGTIVYVNPAFENILGYSKEEAIGKTPRIFKSGTLSMEYYKNFWNDILTKKSIIHEIINKTKDGRLLSFEASVNPIINEKDEIIGFIAIERDITERKQNEQELIKAKEKAEESDRLKTAFINNISHEIRTPLNSILGFGQFLVESELSEEERREYFEHVEESSNRLMNTITDYIDAAMIVTNTMKVYKKEFILEPFFEMILEKTKQLCSDKKREFEVEIPIESAGLTVNSDPEFIQKILGKLLDNAIKFTKEGSITCGYKIKTEHIEFFVKDTGRGIDSDMLDLIFEIFCQADNSMTRGYEGSGLGLPIAKGLVTLLGGEMHATSEKGKGSVFSFTIPLKNSGKSISPDAIDITKPKSTKKPLILIAEDDELNYMYLAIILKSAGHNHIHAVNGKDAVDYCRENPDISIVLMDIKMPVMNGDEATKQIREFRPELPIIATTAHALTGDEHRFLEAGFNDYCAKPISEEILLSIIRKYVE